jgi:hypothetical protein
MTYIYEKDLVRIPYKRGMSIIVYVTTVLDGQGIRHHVERMHTYIANRLGIPCLPNTHFAYVKPVRICYLRRKTPWYDNKSWRKKKPPLKLAAILEPDILTNDHLLFVHNGIRDGTMKDWAILENTDHLEMRIVDKLSLNTWPEMENMLELMLRNYGNVKCTSSTYPRSLRNNKRA